MRSMTFISFYCASCKLALRECINSYVSIILGVRKVTDWCCNYSQFCYLVLRSFSQRECLEPLMKYSTVLSADLSIQQWLDILNEILQQMHHAVSSCHELCGYRCLHYWTILRFEKHLADLCTTASYPLFFKSSRCKSSCKKEWSTGAFSMTSFGIHKAAMIEKQSLCDHLTSCYCWGICMKGGRDALEFSSTSAAAKRTEWKIERAYLVHETLTLSP